MFSNRVTLEFSMKKLHAPLRKITWSANMRAYQSFNLLILKVYFIDISINVRL